MSKTPRGPSVPKDVPVTLQLLITNLTEFLADAGFNPQYSKFADRGRRHLIWHRECAWKRDSIRMVNRSYLGVHRVSLQAQVELRLRDDILNQPFTLLDATNIAILPGATRTDDAGVYSINGILACMSGSARKAWCERLVRDAGLGLNFLDRFSTPERCLAYIPTHRSSVREHGSVNESRILDYLKSLIVSG